MADRFILTDAKGSGIHDGEHEIRYGQIERYTRGMDLSHYPLKAKVGRKNGNGDGGVVSITTFSEDGSVDRQWDAGAFAVICSHTLARILAEELAEAHSARYVDVTEYGRLAHQVFGFPAGRS